ncbi:glycosyltransferase family 2 protein [bacterium]|nr:glycosyltransferase family 2 protein [bacterium]
MTLSVILVVKNEEQNIARCLRTVSFADEILVADSGSTDRTVEIASRFTNKIFDVEKFHFSGTKQFLLEKATSDWALWIDADEWLTPELERSIKDVLRTRSDYSGYYILRQSCYLGRWMKHSGWYPDWVLRLFRREEASFDGKAVHEGVNLTGKVGRLSGKLLHHPYRNISHHLEKMNLYTDLWSNEMLILGRKSSMLDVSLRPIWKIISTYLLKFGMLDGFPGLVLSVMSGYYTFLKYAKLYEKSRNSIS